MSGRHTGSGIRIISRDHRQSIDSAIKKLEHARATAVRVHGQVHRIDALLHRLRLRGWIADQSPDEAM